MTYTPIDIPVAYLCKTQYESKNVYEKNVYGSKKLYKKAI